MFTTFLAPHSSPPRARDVIFFLGVLLRSYSLLFSFLAPQFLILTHAAGPQMERGVPSSAEDEEEAGRRQARPHGRAGGEGFRQRSVPALCYGRFARCSRDAGAAQAPSRAWAGVCGRCRHLLSRHRNGPSGANSSAMPRRVERQRAVASSRPSFSS